MGWSLIKSNINQKKLDRSIRIRSPSMLARYLCHPPLIPLSRSFVIKHQDSLGPTNVFRSASSKEDARTHPSRHVPLYRRRSVGLMPSPGTRPLSSHHLNMPQIRNPNFSMRNRIAKYYEHKGFCGYLRPPALENFDRDLGKGSWWQCAANYA